MKRLICTTLVVFAALAVLLLVAPTRSYALEDIELVDKERARELGLQIRSVTAGAGTVHVQLEIPIKGELKNFTRVEFRIHDGEQLLLSSTLKEERSKPEHVLVSFYADPKTIERITLKVVTEDGLERVGREIKVKEFIE